MADKVSRRATFCAWQEHRIWSIDTRNPGLERSELHLASSLKKIDPRSYKSSFIIPIKGLKIVILFYTCYLTVRNNLLVSCLVESMTTLSLGHPYDFNTMSC